MAMENGLTATSKQLTVKNLFQRDEVRQKFQELLGKKSASFMTSVLQIVAQNDALASADPHSIYHSAAVAATMDLPLNANLGFAYIIPYDARQKDGTFKKVAQFQMGYKGFIQLSQRSGQFRTVNCSDVRQGEIKKFDRLSGEIEFQWEEDQAKRLTLPIIGFVAFFKLLNGFEKSFYMTVDELKKHGLKYSKTYSSAKQYVKDKSLWTTDFESMAGKTVLKLLLAKYAPLSIEMQTAVIVDQGLINDVGATDVTYVDNDEEKIDKETERVALMIDDCKNIQELENLQRLLSTDGLQDLWNQKHMELNSK